MSSHLKRGVLALAVSLASLLLAGFVLSPQARRLAPIPAAYQELTFAQMGDFKYRPSHDGKPQTLPSPIQALGGRLVKVQGFMVPIDFHGREVKSFLLCKNQNACCFGLMPAMNEWIFVTLSPGTQAAVQMDRPLLVAGRLDVGEEFKAGAVVSLYRMQADRVQLAGS